MQISTTLIYFEVCCVILATPLLGSETHASAAAPKSVLIVYHGGDPTRGPSPPLDTEAPDGFTHATTRNVNVETVARELQKRLELHGIRAELRGVDTIKHPKELLAYDGIVIGSPVWFSNMSYPIKRFFDTQLIRIYEHRTNRLNDKVMSGFCTVMESGMSGPRALQALLWGLEHLTARTVEGMVVQISEQKYDWLQKVDKFADRIARALQ